MSPIPEISPRDEHNVRLLSNIHPPEIAQNPDLEILPPSAKILGVDEAEAH